jgi:microsomal dipeptidase-like Zn-dependent dipeptidase
MVAIQRYEIDAIRDKLEDVYYDVSESKQDIHCRIDDLERRVDELEVALSTTLEGLNLLTEEALRVYKFINEKLN